MRPTTFVGLMFDAIEKWLSPTVRGLEARLDRLEAESLSYRGVWTPGTAYPKSACVTHGGAVWLATRDTSDKPHGGEHSPWKLIAKGTS